jgi:NADPH2:quinone reductase
MKAAFVDQTGPADSIRYADLPEPEIGPSQCLVRVAAVAVNPVDTYIRSGMVEMPLKFPFVLGCDLAGTVAGVGEKVTQFSPGDRVWGSNQGLLGRQGTFSEWAAVDECWLYPTPDGVSDVDVGALALVGITAHLGLKRDGKLRPHEMVFINGASGGVGSTVIQMAKAMGARVVATTGSDAKAERCQQLGADFVINYHSEDVQAALKKICPAGVHLWWETLREPNFDLAIGCLASRGRMIVMAGREARPPFPVGPFYVKGCSMHGFVMFLATPEEQRTCAEEINRWLAEGKLKANIDRILPLSETAEAHRIQEQSTIHKTGALSGKIVLKP